MNYLILSFAAAGMLTFVGNFAIAMLIYYQRPRWLVNQLFGLFFFSVSIYGLGFLLQSFTTNYQDEMTAIRILLFGTIFIPVFLTHAAHAITKKKISRRTLVTIYSIAILLSVINITTDLFARDPTPRFGLRCLFQAGPLYPVLAIFFAWGSTLSLYRLFCAYRQSAGADKNRFKYLFWGLFIGFLGGSIGFMLGYSIDTFPFNPYCSYAVFLGNLFIGYAIYKHHLMDIKLVVTSTGIFVAIYSIVLGIPFWLGFGLKQWMYSLISMGVLATAGPYVYGKLKEKAQRAILRRQLEYQHAIKEFAKTLSQLKTVDELFSQTVGKLSRLVLPKHIAIYAFSKGEKAFVSRLTQAVDGYIFKPSIPKNSNFIEILAREHRPIFGDTMDDCQHADDSYETILVPFFAESMLYGFIILGPKQDDLLYSSNDIEVFEILATNLSLSVENILFWNEEKTRLMREEQIRRQRAMDHFAASLAHEIDNPIFGVQCSLEALKATMDQELKVFLPPDKVEYLFGTITEILQNIRNTSKLIRAIREFSAQNNGALVPLSMDETVEHFVSMIEPQLKHDRITFIKEIESNIFICGNKIHLVEVLMNLAGNSIHAVKNNNKAEKLITFRFRKNGPDTCLIELSDNGYGIDKDMTEDIFLDFVTTKVAGEGSGMGLARAKKIAEAHKGKIWAYSEGKGTGAAFFIELPLLK